jgi:hypothetical protein
MTSHGQSVTESPSGRPTPAKETRMRAIVQEAYGSPDALHLAHIARPAIMRPSTRPSARLRRHSQKRYPGPPGRAPA